MKKKIKKSVCCNANLLIVDGEPVQCECCGADGRKFNKDNKIKV